MNNSCQDSILDAIDVQFIFRPSAQYTVPTESIPNNGILALRCHAEFFAYFRHVRGPEPDAYYTYISVVNLATERTIFSLRYDWKCVYACARKLPPVWIHSPSSQVCDLCISKQMLAFATTELVLVYTHFDSGNITDGAVRAIDLEGIVKGHHHMRHVNSICLSTTIKLVCAVIQGKRSNGDLATLVVLVDSCMTGLPPRVVHYQLDQSLDVKTFGPNNVLALLGDPATEESSEKSSGSNCVLALQFTNSRHETELRVIHMPLNETTSYPQVLTVQAHAKGYLALLTRVFHKKDNGTLIVACQCPATFSHGYFAALSDLSRTFSTPFFSLVASDTSKLGMLSSRLNSPWAMPIALMHLFLFILLLPFLFFPERATKITISATTNPTTRELGIVCSRRQCFLKRPFIDTGPFSNSHQLFRAGTNFYGLVPDPKLPTTSLLLQKLSPTALSKSAYSQPDTFRTLSIFCYLVCLAVFAGSMIVLFKTVPNVKVDLIVEVAIADAASVYLLAVCQDLVLGYTMLTHKLRRKLSEYKQKQNHRQAQESV